MGDGVFGEVPGSITPRGSRKLIDLVSEFCDVFALDDTKLGCTQMVQHSINTRQPSPNPSTEYRMPVVGRGKLVEMVESMQNQSVKVRYPSPWASTLHLSPIDYRQLDAITGRMCTPSPVWMTF